jgi:hypothetical protein
MNSPKTPYNESEPRPIPEVQTASGDSSHAREVGKKPTYSEFLASKVVIADERGSESASLTLRPHLFRVLGGWSGIPQSDGTEGNESNAIRF